LWGEKKSTLDNAAENFFETLYNLLIELKSATSKNRIINPLNAQLNPICHLPALLGAHHILHVSRLRVKLSMTLRLIYNFSPERSGF
jgi:hypothetical protein